MVKHPSTRAKTQAATTKTTPIARNSGELEQFSPVNDYEKLCHKREKLCYEQYKKS